MNDIIVGPGEVSSGALDLDHTCGGIREAARAQRRGHRLLDGDDQHAFERRARHQNDFGRPSTFVATCDKIRFVEIGAI